MSQIDVPPLPKLPLGATISLAYAWFFEKFTDILRISWLWLVLFAIAAAAVGWLQWNWFATSLAAITKDRAHYVPFQPSLPASFFWLSIVLYIVTTLGTVSIAVAWHRRIILDELPGLSGGNVASAPLWRYIGTGFVLALVFVLPYALVLLPGALLLGGPSLVTPGQPPNSAFFLLIPLVFIFYVACLAVVLRLIVLLPARAVGDTDLTFGQAWHRTRGNIWRMFWGLVACVVPPIILLQIIFAVIMAMVGMPKFAPAALSDGSVGVPVVTLTIMNTLLFVLNTLIAPIYIGFLSHSYRHFFQGGIAPAR